MTFEKKLENFWYYHKWHTLFAVGAVLFAVLISYQMMTKTVYDNEIIVAGNVPSTLADAQSFAEDISYCFDDTNDDGEINITTTFIPFGTKIDSIDDAEMAIAYPQQLSALIAADDANIFIVSEDILLDYGKDKAFADITELQKELGLEEKHYNGIKIKDFTLLKELNLYPDVDYYFAVRVHDELDTMGDKKRIKYENAYAFLREVVKG